MSALSFGLIQSLAPANMPSHTRCASSVLSNLASQTCRTSCQRDGDETDERNASDSPASFGLSAEVDVVRGRWSRSREMETCGGLAEVEGSDRVRAGTSDGSAEEEEGGGGAAAFVTMRLTTVPSWTANSFSNFVSPIALPFKIHRCACGAGASASFADSSAFRSPIVAVGRAARVKVRGGFTDLIVKLRVSVAGAASSSSLCVVVGGSQTGTCECNLRQHAAPAQHA